MTMKHVTMAMDAELPAPDKPVLPALILDAGHHARVVPETLAFLTGYDEPSSSSPAGTGTRSLTDRSLARSDRRQQMLIGGQDPDGSN